MDLAAQHLGRQPRLIRLGAVGAVRPHIAARIVRRHDLGQHPAITVGGRRRRTFADEAIAAVDDDVRFVAECRDRDHWQRRSVGAVTHLAAILQCPAGVRVLLGGLARFGRPYLIGGLARLNRRLLILVFRCFGAGKNEASTIWPDIRCPTSD